MHGKKPDAGQKRLKTNMDDMNNEVLFKESQKFKQWWLWLILFGINGLFLFGVFKQVIGGQQFGDKPMSNTGLIIVTALSFLLTLFFLNLRLDTKIKEDGIYVRFFPFHLSFKQYGWEELTKSYVRQYAPVSEYGGWGLKYGMFGKGTAYNVSGNKGLQLEFTNKKKLLIGTNKPEELTALLKKMGKLKQ